MRYVFLRTEIVDGRLSLSGLNSLSYRASGITPVWIDFCEAKTDCVHPEKCDFLSFDSEKEARELLEKTGMEDDLTIACIGVDCE
jgi:hypothetical protein